MKIEVDKEYVDGKGTKVTIVSEEQCQHVKVYLGSNGWVDVDDREDLVEEYHGT